MKKKLLVVFRTLLLCSMIMFAGCEEEDSSSDYDNGGNNGGGGSSAGSWVRSDNGNSFLKFEGSTAKACVGGNLTTGTFNGSSMTYVVSGNTITFPLSFYSDHLVVGVPEGAEDTNYEMTYYHADSFPCGGGGSNGGGGGSSTGNATFWIQSDLGCGSINVSVSGQNGTITSYYSSGSPSCGAGGCANFSLPAGSYTFTASCSEYTWNGSITVTNGGCSKMKLTL